MTVSKDARATLECSKVDQREFSMKVVEADMSLKKVHDALKSTREGVDLFKVVVDGKVLVPLDFEGEDAVIDPLASPLQVKALPVGC
ncbi:hypothetical protein RJT34_07883 [Clitoria ternatea]|uniref:Uncharacterized protein n=1 Tax=Clitoria ternatea TaxID=43366 RepID=A0AAN9PVA7_CLITE